MKITKRLSVIAAVVLALLVVAVPVVASGSQKPGGFSKVTFKYGACTVTTNEWWTHHPPGSTEDSYLVSTNVGFAEVTSACLTPLFGVRTGTGAGTVVIPFTVVDVRTDPTGPVTSTHGILHGVGINVIGLLLRWSIPVRAGVEVQAILLPPQPLTYCGYGYALKAGENPNGPVSSYLILPFKAEVGAGGGFTVTFPPNISPCP